MQYNITTDWVLLGGQDVDVANIFIFDWSIPVSSSCSVETTVIIIGHTTRRSTYWRQDPWTWLMWHLEPVSCALPALMVCRSFPLALAGQAQY